MIIQYIGEPIKRIECIAMFTDSLCISSNNTYIKMYYLGETKPYFRHRLRVCFGTKGVHSTLLRKLVGMPCTLRIYTEGKIHMTVPCWFVKFENELSGFNKGGYRLEFQEYDKYDAYFYV
jgi:hypothetical protein